MTDVYELDVLIALQLLVKDILTLSQVSSYWYRLINGLWRDLIRRDFQITRWVGEPREQYRYLMNVRMLPVLEHGRLDGLELLHRMDPVCRYEAKWALMYGHEEMFWWIVEHGVEPTADLLDTAIQYSLLGVFERLWAIPLRPERVQPGNLEMAHRMIELGFTPDENWADWALFSDETTLLDFLYQRDIVPTDLAFGINCEGDCLELLQWIHARGILLPPCCLTTAAFHGNIDMLKWLYQVGMVPVDNRVLISMCCWGNLEDLGWLEERGWGNFDSECSDAALKEGQLHVVEWLLDREIQPSLGGLERAAPEAHQWVEEYRGKL